MARIPHLELNELNKQLERIDQLEKRIADLHSQVKAINGNVAAISNTHVPIQFNTLTFNWTGATGTISWAAGAVVNKLKKNLPVAAGSIAGLSPNTYYWMAWNPFHQRMIAQVGLNGVLQIHDNIVLCQLYTGTAGQTGVAGGGGSSSSGSDLTGGRYKLF